jgi:hypothetical protein
MRRMEAMLEHCCRGSAASTLSRRNPKKLLPVHPLLPPDPIKPSFLMPAPGREAPYQTRNCTSHFQGV